MTITRRTSVRLIGTALALGAVTAPAAGAVTSTRLVDGRLIDATSDGRYVLYESATGPQLLDRTAGTTLPVPAGAEQLADRAPRILIRDGSAFRVLDVAAGFTVLATLDEQTNVVPATKAELVRDGRSVIFETGTGEARRTLERKLDTATTVERLRGAEFLHASEDARVITWKRPLPPAQRPAGTIPLPDDPAGGVPGTAVGYRVEDQAPRVVRTTSWMQFPDGPIGSCTGTRYRGMANEPTDLQISQNGAEPRYAMWLRVRSDRAWFGRPSVEDNLFRIDEGNEPQVFGADLTIGSRYAVTPDPVSGSLGFQTTSGADRAFGTLADPRQSFGLAIGGESNAGFGPAVVPIEGGAGALADAAPAGAARGVYAFGIEPADRDPQAPARVRFTELPRERDAVDGPTQRAEVLYQECLFVGALSDYAKVSPAGRGALTVQYNPAPEGKRASARLNATVSWYGITLWSRTFIYPGSFTTPAVPSGIPGFKLTLRAAPYESAPLTASYPIR